ncbi:hypothetical protein [Arthrobacter sp. NPDC057013]|uniref:hypothetical protein n=1 Tax=Arthrobacter sp. NPDC057013 TaxID=3345999 RepID=UPI00363E43AC
MEGVDIDPEFLAIIGNATTTAVASTLAMKVPVVTEKRMIHLAAAPAVVRWVGWTWVSVMVRFA